ncbi:DUF3800 domain-containing protein [Acidisphaera sp. L21]|uniref:DUF3800 domain-containing protein n=1 Tax=Acidisphaera sp. L21 TaxID=1641851 RepID=UPI00131BEDE9|nr:DUF3800 domain-containing protein [Acidisphaera sp. L21]
MASPVGYVAYIDEAGDDGIKSVAPIDSTGASEWFVLGAFVVPIHDDAFVQQWLVEAMSRINSPQRRDIHFAKLDDRRKEILCEYLSTLTFRWFVSVSHKPNMRGYRNTRAELVHARNYFYNWMARVLLEKVSRYCSVDSKTRYRGDPQRKLRIEFSTRGGMSYEHTKDYLAKLWLRSREGRMVLTKDNLSWDVIDIQQVHHASHRERAGLQLADVVTSAFYRGLTSTGGRRGDTRFAEILKPRVASGSDGVFRFGVKLQPDQWADRLSGDQKAIFEMFGAPM